jgi:hypothetical protein
MDLQSQIVDAIRQELRRQAADSLGQLTVEDATETLQVHGPVDLEALAQVVTGAVAGGP